MKRRFAFVGPTVAPSDPIRSLPGVEFRPPARHGSLYRESLTSADRVLIVDGIYQQSAPIRHQEILAHIQTGVHVSGAASMGALRAAELSSYGMAGSGEVFYRVADGRISDDAEVAVVHAGAEDGFRPLGVAMISLQVACEELEQTGEVSARDAARVVELARSLHFTERSWSALAASAAPWGLSGAVAAVSGRLRAGHDIKLRDAREALRVLAGPANAHRAPRSTVATEATSTKFNPAAQTAPALSALARGWALDETPVRPGSPVTVRVAIATLQLLVPDYPQRHLAYARRLATLDLRGRRPFSAGGMAGQCPPWLTAPSAATRGWSREDRRLARTFRLYPGRNVYTGLNRELLGEDRVEDVEDVAAALLTGRRHSGRREVAATLATVWAPDGDRLELAALERGFRNLEEAFQLLAMFDHARIRSLGFGR
jgi:hypothetical protein